MRYIDRYPECVGCPHLSYCGKMVGSIRLCNSYDDGPVEEDEYVPEDLIGDYTDATGLEV